MSATLPAKSGYAHVALGSDGVPVITGTTMKVVELVMAQKAHGWSPEELVFQHPYLTLSQIHSALAYYWDHKDQLDDDMARRSRFAEQARDEAGPSRMDEKLRGGVRGD